jgi:hypothetical protein
MAEERCVTEPEWDALCARVLATPDGKIWMDELERRSGVPIAFAVADWKARIARMRERWRTGELTPQ